MAKPALGRGLGALLGGNVPAGKAAASSAASSAPAHPPTPVPAPPPPAPETGERVRLVPIAKVHPSPLQPRKDFSAEALRELADSIAEQGIVQPLIVRPRGNEYELIAGERRWRAAQLLKLTEVPAIVREIKDDAVVLEMALIENLQRENLNPIEEALGYAQLIEQFKLTQEAAAAKVGRGRVVVANSLRLLKLAPEIQVYVRKGQLSAGHAKVLLGLAGAAEQKLAAERVIAKALNVRQTEDLVAMMQAAAKGKPAPTTGSKPMVTDAHVAALHHKIQERFGTKVRFRYRKGKGAVEIRFFNDDDLERILKLLNVNVD